ncbi:MAG: mechanosensitive ion channel [Actinomycetota bacterium]|nr:mechanosensitive ion channel [Actinomycetota bacterium]
MFNKFKNVDELAGSDNNIVNSLYHNWVDMLTIVLIVVVLITIIKLIEKNINRRLCLSYKDENFEINRGRYTLASIIIRLLIFFLIIAGLMMILYELNLNIVPLISTTGIVALIVGIGIPNFFRDILIGASIAFEQQVRLNDKITVGSISGIVEKINLRNIVVRSSDGTIHYIPNSEIKILSNHSFGWSKLKISLNISSDESIEKVISVLNKIFDEFSEDKILKKYIIEKPALRDGGLVCSLSSSNVSIEILCTAIPRYKGIVERSLLTRIRNEFYKEKIKLA